MEKSLENKILSYKSGFLNFDLSQQIDAKLFFNIWRARFFNEDELLEMPDQLAIKRNILQNDITVILGNPLSGKSRAVYEGIKEIKSGTMYMLNQDITLHPPVINDVKENAIYYFDDIDQSIEKYPKIINSLLTQIITKNNKLIITCRTGPEYKILESQIDKKILPVLVANRFIIKRLKHSDPKVQEFIKQNHNGKHKGFDFNIGSLYIPIEDMRKRYTKLLSSNDKYPVTILKGLKFHHHLYNYENNKRTYDIYKIRTFCNKYLNEEIENYEWDIAIGKLTSTDKDLNFIDIDDVISIEEAYLESNEDDYSLDVIENTFTFKNSLKIFRDIYKDPFENKALGFRTSTRDFNELIKKSDNYSDGLEILNKMLREGPPPDSYTFSILMQKTNNWDEVQFLYESLQTCQIDPRIVINSVLSGKATSFTAIIDLCTKVRSNFFNQKKIGNIVAKIKKIGYQNTKDNLEFLFKKFDSLVIFHNPNLLAICEHLVVDNSDFQTYIYPYFENLYKLDKPFLKWFIKMTSKTGNKKLTIDILNTYFKEESFYYYKEMANSIKEEEPLESLKLYLKASELSNNEREKIIALTNYCQSVYENNVTKKIDYAIQSCYKAIKTQKVDHSKFPYLRYILILLEIQKSDILDLPSVLNRLTRRKHISLGTIKKIVDKIIDDEKKKVVFDYTKSTVNNV